MKPNYLLVLQLSNLLWHKLIQVYLFQWCNQILETPTTTYPFYKAKLLSFNTEICLKGIKTTSKIQKQHLTMRKIIIPHTHTLSKNNKNQYLVPQTRKKVPQTKFTPYRPAKIIEIPNPVPQNNNSDTIVPSK